MRSGLVSTSNPNLVLTGSYDATVRLFDARSGQCEMTMGDSITTGLGVKTPVEQVLMFPTGTVALSSAGPIIRVWDLVAGGRCIRALSNHQKTVTAMSFDATASRLLTGSLDQMVKVYDVSTYKVVHTMRYPAPLLCLAISVCIFHLLFDLLLNLRQPDETHIVAGMSDGTLSVRRRQSKPSEAQVIDSLRSGAFESFLGTTIPPIGQGAVRKKIHSQSLGDVDEFRVESRRTKRLKEYDKFLKSFKYSAALDSVLRKVCSIIYFCCLLLNACQHQQVPPTTTFSLIQELIHRDGLRIALSGRDDVLLEPVLRLLVKYITDPRFGEMVCDIAGMVIGMYLDSLRCIRLMPFQEMYGPILGQSPLIDSLFLRLQKKATAELRFQKELVKTKGALNMVFSLMVPLHGA